MNKTINIRIRLSDFRAIKRVFPALRKETAANYFSRLALELQK